MVTHDSAGGLASSQSKQKKGIVHCKKRVLRHNFQLLESPPKTKIFLRVLEKGCQPEIKGDWGSHAPPPPAPGLKCCAELV